MILIEKVMKLLFAILITLGLAAPSLAEDLSIETTIGDGSNVEIYSFIKDFLLNEPKLSKAKTQMLEKSEHDGMTDEDYKPLSAAVCEGEIAHLLYILCERKSWCENITLYQINGVSIASSGFRDDSTTALSFASARPDDLNIGILNLETASPPRIASYQNDKGVQYTEYLRSIYYNKQQDYAYVDNSPRDSSDKLVGYISYISNNTKESY